MKARGAWKLAPLSLAIAACASMPALDQGRLVDLTHTFRDRTLSAPGDAPLVIEHDARRRDDGHWLATGSISGPEYAGTHVDAPLRYSENKRGVDEIPLAQMVAPIRTLNVERRCAKDRDHRVSIEDLRDHERTHGRVPAGAAVLIRTGWSKHWEQSERYLGGKDEFHFPGLSVELASELAARKVDLVGIDTAGIDPGNAVEPAAQRVLADANLPCLENLAIPEGFPAVGATLIALPMKIERGSGSPTRVVAIVP